MSEFDMRLTSLRSGIIAALVGLVKYLVLPYLLLFILIAALRSAGHPDWNQLLTDMQQVVLIFGSILTCLSFFKGFYPAGSYSRAMFAVLMLPVIVLFTFSLLLNGRVQDVFDAEGVDFDVMLLFYFAFAAAALGMMVGIGEFADSRHAFLLSNAEKLGRPAPSPLVPEDPAQHRWWHDFRLSYGRWKIGFQESRASLMRFIVLPIVLFLLFAAILAKIDEAAPVNFQMELEQTAGLLLLLGIPIVALSFFKGFYPKGSVSRFIPWAVLIGIVCLWIWTASLGGKVSIEAIGMATVNMDYGVLILIIIFGVSLYAVYALVEMISYRPDWRRNSFYPVDDALTNQRRKQEKARKRLEKQQRKDAEGKS